LTDWTRNKVGDGGLYSLVGVGGLEDVVYVQEVELFVLFADGSDEPPSHLGSSLNNFQAL
jgi:hypothetical protein